MVSAFSLASILHSRFFCFQHKLRYIPLERHSISGWTGKGVRVWNCVIISPRSDQYHVAREVEEYTNTRRNQRLPLPCLLSHSKPSDTTCKQYLRTSSNARKSQGAFAAEASRRKNEEGTRQASPINATAVALTNVERELDRERLHRAGDREGKWLTMGGRAGWGRRCEHSDIEAGQSRVAVGIVREGEGEGEAECTEPDAFQGPSEVGRKERERDPI